MRPLLMITIIVLAMAFMLTACEKDRPAEKFGKKIDQTVEETKENAQQAKENIEGAVKTYVDDAVITAEVKAAIFNEPTLKTLQITVETFKGDVQLSGFVDSAQSVNKAGAVARNVNGVVSVKNDLVVK